MVPSGNVQTCHIAELRAELALGMVCCGAAFSSALLGNVERRAAVQHHPSGGRSECVDFPRLWNPVDDVKSTGCDARLIYPCVICFFVLLSL